MCLRTSGIPLPLLLSQLSFRSLDVLHYGKAHFLSPQARMLEALPVKAQIIHHIWLNARV